MSVAFAERSALRTPLSPRQIVLEELAEKERAMALVDIRGLDKADVLAALFNAAKIVDPNAKDFLWPEQAEELLEKEKVFTWLYGRSLYIDLSGSEFPSNAYDHDNGQGMAQKIIDNVRETGTHWNQAELDEALVAFREFLETYDTEPNPSITIISLPDDKKIE